MTIWYLDPISGSDSNAGTSWAAPYKTFAAGPTVAKGLLQGDTIRVAKSPDPVSIGTATWTSRKVSNSVTFDASVSKTVDLCKVGWVAGAGAVTNNQSTAAVTETVFGNGSPSALQYTGSANSGKICYKNLGAVTDFSAYQQVSFWFRSTVAVDLSGANNMTLNLCSDTIGATAVNTLTFPKFNIAANTWYPIVIDNGAALGTNIQSISFQTGAMTVTGNYYFDEIFATPAGGLTLWSLLGDNDSAWYPIKTVRGADVQLFGGYQPSGANALVTGSNSSVSSEAWIGTTANFTTYKRETTKMYTTLGTTGPTSATFCTTLAQGIWSTTAKSLITYSFGWNTSSNTQDSFTFIDNISQVGIGFAFAHNNIRVENLVFTRLATGMNNTTYNCEHNNLSAIGCQIGLSFSNSAYPNANYFNLNKTVNIGPMVCNGGAFTNTPTAGNVIGYTFNLGKNINNPPGMALTQMLNSTINFGTVSAFALDGGSSAIVSPNQSGANTFNTWNFQDLSIATRSQTCRGYMFNGAGGGDIVNIVNTTPSSGGATGGAIIGAQNGATGVQAIFNITNINSSCLLFGSPSSGVLPINNCVTRVTNPGSTALPTTLSAQERLYLQDWGGAGFAKILCGTISSGVVASFDLQVGDVHTAGSKAWKYTPASINYPSLIHDIKLASVAAVANKLVTITCYVKSQVAATNMLAGIEVPAIFLPGYTTDQVATFSGTTGTYQQVTITFTPTADCVFDVIGFVKYIDVNTSGYAVWDDLVITQAA
jgi:hypothetical protein